VRWANDRGILVLVITSQAGIARGYYTEDEFRSFTAWIDSELAAFGAHIDATYYCPHHPTEGIGAYRSMCRCRKPSPGLVERAIAEWGIDRARAVMIGDSATDVQAALAAGICGRRFTGGNLLSFVKEVFA
jgi:D-glycero-D-manno-heptose 1,7-bisphosphate phosphatase